MNFKFHNPVLNRRLQNVNNFLPFPNSIQTNKPAGRLIFQFLLIISFSLSINAATYTVNTLMDNETDGCSIGDCTLREAITHANILAGSDTINFDASVFGTIVLDGNALSITSAVTIKGPGARILTVSGNDLSRVFIVHSSGANADISGLTVADGESSPIFFGLVSVIDGGGILNANEGTLNLSYVTLRNNHTTGLGGAISTRTILGGQTNTTITNSTIDNNSATLDGGGISNTGTSLLSSATTTIVNSTISNNLTLAKGGGISNNLGTLSLTNNTISDNRSALVGGGVANVTVGGFLGEAYVRNNIIARNSSVILTGLISSDVLGIFNTFGHNLIGNNLNAEVSFAASVVVGGIHSPNANLDLVGSIGVGYKIIYPLLGSLQNNGGQTDTRLLLIGSPAIDNGDNCVTDGSCASLSNDQRGAGFPRLLNLTVDIGSIEGVAPPNAPLVVSTLADNESDGCDVNECTLREAINTANIDPDFDIINFEPTLTGTVFLNGNQLVISSNLAINGPGARTLSVSGNNSSRVFLIALPILGGDFEVNISGLTLTDGTALPVAGLAGDGGAILNGALLGIVSGKSTLTLNEVNIYNNFATTLGGGVATRLGSETIIKKSLIHENTCNAVPFIPGGDAGGGGVSNTALSTTVIANSTIANNSTLAGGGGILNAAGQMHLTNNTIVNNQSGVVGGGVVSLVGVTTPLGVTNVRNTIIAENNALIGAGLISSDVVGILGSFNSLGNNFIGNNVGAEANFEASLFIGLNPIPNAKAEFVGNVVFINQIIDPQLLPLQDNGGPTNSRLPIPISHVMNAGNVCVYTNTCAVNPGGRNPHESLTFDQRGTMMSRVVNTNPEIGATELPLAPTAANVSISGRILDQNGQGIYRTVVTLTESSGTTFTSISNPFGYFRFDDITAGETVVITASHRQYTFAPQVLTVTEDLTDLYILVDVPNLKHYQIKLFNFGENNK